VDELGILELAADERFSTNPSRVVNRVELRELIIESFTTRPAAEWEVKLKARSIPCSRILNVGDLVQDEQFKALQLLEDTPHPTIPDLQLINLPMKINQGGATLKHGPPLLGAHSDEILTELGYTQEEIEMLRSQNVIE
jgi:crotonobetainyl-CoA:carnitine CoA-transferase CaiB-like acyl-CoA transferase